MAGVEENNLAVLNEVPVIGPGQTFDSVTDTISGIVLKRPIGLGWLAGLGIARLPETVVRADLRSGALSRVLPEWNSPQGILHVVFPSRRGLLPAVRALIDFLAERLPPMM